MLNIILYIGLVIIFVVFIIIAIDVFTYLYNEIEYANKKINFDEYYYNWGMWLGYTLLGNIITLVEKIYNKIYNKIKE